MKEAVEKLFFVRMKKAGKFICQEFIYGGHLLALGASGIAFTSAILLNVKVTWDILFILYLIVCAIYSYNRFKEFKKDFLTNLFRSQHIEKYIKYIPAVIAIYLLLIVSILLFFGNLKSTLLVILMILLGFFYTDYFKKFTEKIIGFKGFYVAFVWSLISVFVAFYYNAAPNYFIIILLFSFIFMRWTVNTIFFDIKDIESDKKEKLKTIPVFFGKEKTLFYLNILNIFSFIPIIIGVYLNWIPLFFLSLIIFCFYSMYYLLAVKNSNIDIQKLSYIMVDGEYVFWPLVLIFGKFIFDI